MADERPLSPLAQRVVIGVGATLLLVAGIVLATGVFEGDDERSPSSASSPPIRTASPTASGSKTVDEWFPWNRAEFTAAGATATEFAERYATEDYTNPAKRHMDLLTEMATRDYAKRLEATSDAASLRTELAEAKTRISGEAVVDQVLRYSTDDVVIVVDLTTTTTDEEGRETEEEPYAVTLVPADEGDWRVSDFAPADVGQNGDLTTG